MSDRRSSDEAPGATANPQNEPERGAVPALSRRGFLRWSAAAGAAAGAGGSLAGLWAGSPAPALAQDEPFPGAEVEEATVAQLQSRMAAGTLTSVQLVQLYLDRIAAIDHSGPTLRSVIQVNPDALAIAGRLDQRAGRRRPARPAPRHPHPAQGQHRHRRPAMQTTAGSLALVGAPAPRDARVVARLRRGRRGDPRQDQPERVGQLPRLQLVQRLERPRRPDPQPLRARPQPLRLELGLGGGGGGQPRRRRPRHRDRRLDRLPGLDQRHRRHQADGGAGQPRRASSPSPTPRTPSAPTAGRSPTPRPCSAP